LTRIAADGSEAALAALLRHAGHENFSIRRAAIQGYLAHGGEQARSVLLKALPERDHFILDIKRVDVRQVPQATGGLHLVSRDKADLPAHDLGRDDAAGGGSYDGKGGKGGGNDKGGCGHC
jgi:hypothetical protein